VIAWALVPPASATTKAATKTAKKLRESFM
jgi:hypothetical protein